MCIRDRWTPLSRAVLDIRYVAERLDEGPRCEGLDALAFGNPAARSLPLLRVLAAKAEAPVRLALTPDSHLELRVSPC